MTKSSNCKEPENKLSIIESSCIPKIDAFNNNNLTIPIRNVNNEPIQYFTKDEINFLLSKVPPDRIMFFQFLWRTGCRVSEAISITKRDIDFENNEILIRWLKSRKYHHRKIPMHKSLKNALYLYTANLNAEDKLFNYTRQRADQLCKKFNFGHAHKFRHSYAINFLRQSKSPMALQELKELLGHHSISSTMVYLQIVPMQLKQSIEAINFD